MHIILFHQYFLGKNDPGGSRWNEFSKYISNDHKIIVLAGNIHYTTSKKILPKTFLNKEIINPNITLYRCWTYAGYNSNFYGRFLGYLSYTLSSFFTGFFLKKYSVIVITSPPLFVGLSALLLSWIKRVPLIFEVRDLWPESAISTGITKNQLFIYIMYKIEYILYKSSKKIVVLTPAFKNNISKRYPKFKNKIEIITNGADLELMQSTRKDNWVREKYNWSDKVVFSYFGAHGIANDLFQVIEVAKFFRDRSDIHFALIGDGMQKQWLKQKVSEYDLNNVQFIDSVSKNKVADFINASDICMAILKKTETFKTVYPNKLFDYMACKKPILITIDGVSRNLIKSSNCGFFVEPGNIKKFKETIDKIMNYDRTLFETLGQNGYNFVVKHFNRQNLSKKYMKLLSSIESADV